MITVYKLDHQGREVWYYAARVLARRETSIRLEAFFDRQDVDVGPVVFEEGDRFVETFYSDRWYNVFAVYGRDGEQFKGWYCNVCRPADIGEHVVRCEDLALDVWVDRRGEIMILDEEEFAALPLSVDERRACRTALANLLALARDAALPA